MTKEQIIELIAERISEYAIKEMNITERIRHTPPYSHAYDALLKKYNGYVDKREELQTLLDHIHDVDFNTIKVKEA